MSKALDLFAVQPGGSLASNAALMLYTRYSEMIFFAAHIHDPKNIAELHNMRIAAKRLRYTLEIFTPAFLQNKEQYLAILNEIKGVQERIGDIHDCDVRVAQIVDYLNQNVVKKPEIRPGLTQLIDLENSTRSDLYTKFAAHWETLAKDGSFEHRFVSTIFSSRPGLVTIKKSVSSKSTAEAHTSKSKPA